MGVRVGVRVRVEVEVRVGVRVRVGVSVKARVRVEGGWAILLSPAESSTVAGTEVGSMFM